MDQAKGTMRGLKERLKVLERGRVGFSGGPIANKLPAFCCCRLRFLRMMPQVAASAMVRGAPMDALAISHTSVELDIGFAVNSLDTLSILGRLFPPQSGTSHIIGAILMVWAINSHAVDPAGMSCRVRMPLPHSPEQGDHAPQLQVIGSSALAPRPLSFFSQFTGRPFTFQDAVQVPQ